MIVGCHLLLYDQCLLQVDFDVHAVRWLLYARCTWVPNMFSTKVLV